jgi:hypothetical protein
MNKHKQGKSRKLTLSRETLRTLEEDVLREIAGGAPTEYVTCTESTRRASNCVCTDGTCYASCS